MRQHNVQFKVWAAFAVALSMSIVDRRLSTRWQAPDGPNVFATAQSRQACSSLAAAIFFARPYVCSRRLVRIEVLHDAAISGALIASWPGL